MRQDLAFLPGYEQSRQRTRALALLCLVILTGTTGFMAIEGWGIWRALYFTLITITTVGYGDEGISEVGKIFATVLLIGGIGIASYAFALTIQTAVASQLAWRKQMQKRINRLTGHTIVCGHGRMGRTVCQELSVAGVPFVVIEKSDEGFTRACEAGYMAIQGDASVDETLCRAGVEYASHIVCVLPHEPDAIVVTMSARVLNRKITIVTRAETDEGVRKLEMAGADRVVSLYHAGGVEITSTITKPHVADLLAHSSLSGADVALGEVEVQEGSPLVGKTIESYGRTEGSRMAFIALQRVGREAVLRPGGRTRFAAGDLVVVAGDPDQVDRMRRRAVPRRRVRKRVA